jgi:subtilisin family serine protease
MKPYSYHQAFMICLMSLTTFFSSCSKKSDESTQVKDIWESAENASTPIRGEIYSNRPISYDSQILMLELEQPALLSNLKKENGKLVVDSEAKNKLLAEQEAMIEKIKELDSSSFVIFRYHYTLNALAVLVKKDKVKEVKTLAGLNKVESTTAISRPEISSTAMADSIEAITESTVKFIGADKLHQNYITKGDQKILNDGSGMKIGVIDSGVDFTHKMLGGSGLVDDYKAIDPAQESDLFPNKKVTGGIDLVGSKYHGAHGNFSRRIPQPDKNPMDEVGHGTHVAATIAGIGDNIKSYSGVAPGSEIHAIKVFGKSGSTDTFVIIQGFEYAVDPNADFDLSDKLDVLNLSLGSNNGQPHSLYQKAISSLEDADMTVVAAAGNSGNNAYIVGSPSTSESALSVAAGVDNMPHNVGFPTIKVDLEEGNTIFPQMIEGAFTKPIKQAKADGDLLSGELIHVGMADKDFSDELKAQIKGKITLIDRGETTFVEKIKRATEAGAIGVIMVNNKPEGPIVMGGEGKAPIVGVMISLESGDAIKETMKSKAVIANLASDKMHIKMELVDNLTSFSSRGPRSVDALIKPEVAAPGQAIISAKMGGGDEAVKMSGTSMATPHMAGVIALIKQKHTALNVKEIKSLVIGTAKQMTNAKGEVYPVSYQGGGRVQVQSAANASFLSLPATLSLGNHSLVSKKMVRKTIELKNITDKDLTLVAKVERTKGMEVKLPESVTIKAKSSAKVKVSFIIEMGKDGPYSERDALISFSDESTQTMITVPALAVISQISQIAATDLKIYASDELDSDGAAVDLTLTNKGKHAGEALIFNLIGIDERRSQKDGINPVRNGQCDLESAGYRISTDEEGKTFLEIAAKTYMPQTTWTRCEVSVLIDADGDQVIDQELAAIKGTNLPGLGMFASGFYSVLLDAKKVKEIRLAYELNSKNNPDGANFEAYIPAIQDLQELNLYNQSSITVMKADISALMSTAQGHLKFKMATLSADAAVSESDDFLGTNKSKQWVEINTVDQDTSFREIPEKVELAAGETKTIELTKGALNHEMIIYMPFNMSSQSSAKKDQQSALPKAMYTFD